MGWANALVKLSQLAAEDPKINEMEFKEALAYGAQPSLSIYLDTPPNYVVAYETKDQDFGKEYIGKTVDTYHMRKLKAM